MQEYLINNKSVKMIDLRRSGDYPQHLLDMLMNRDFTELEKFPSDTKSNKDYMYALLYAIKNELNTYEVYKYLSESLQSDVELTAEVILKEPKLFRDTPLSNDVQFIKDHIEESPDIAQYMSTQIKSDPNAVREICSSASLPVKVEVMMTCAPSIILHRMPEVAVNATLISAIAIQNPQIAFALAGSELKNDMNFMKDIASKNENVIDSVIKDLNGFGNEGIKGIKQASRDYSMNDCTKLISDMAEVSDDKRYAKVQSKLQEAGTDNVCAMRWVTAMAAQNENVDPETVNRALNYSILTMEDAKRNMAEVGDQAVNKETMLQLITPHILHKLVNNLEKQGHTISPEMLARLEDYEASYNEYHDKFVEQKRKKREEELQAEAQSKEEGPETERAEESVTTQEEPQPEEPVVERPDSERDEPQPEQEEKEEGRDMSREIADLSTTLSDKDQAFSSIQATLEEEKETDLGTPPLDGKTEMDSPSLDQ